MWPALSIWCGGAWRRCLLVLPLGFLIGAACALFLWLLDEVTMLRFHHGWLLFPLPIGASCLLPPVVPGSLFLLRSRLTPHASVTGQYSLLNVHCNAQCSTQWSGGVLVDLAYKYSTPAGKALNVDMLFKEITGEQQPDVPAQVRPELA